MSDPYGDPSSGEIAGSQSIVALAIGGVLLVVAVGIGAFALLMAAFGTVAYWLFYTAAALAVAGIALIVFAFVRLSV
jgi:hypothetical protein